MRRVARVTEDIGCGDGGFYLEDPDIPAGLTCQDWRQRRAQARRTERREMPRPYFSRPALRPAFGAKP